MSLRPMMDFTDKEFFKKLKIKQLDFKGFTIDWEPEELKKLSIIINSKTTVLCTVQGLKNEAIDYLKN